jgi:hypothetical protein
MLASRLQTLPQQLAREKVLSVLSDREGVGFPQLRMFQDLLNELGIID